MFGWSKEAVQLRMLLALVVLFVVSAVTSCSELRYRIWGRTAAAKLLNAQNTTRSTRGGKDLLLTYEFMDIDGSTRKEDDYVDGDWPVPAADQTGARHIQVQFIPGSPGSSRVPEQGRWFLIGLFLVTMTAMAIQFVRFYLGFQEHQRRMARSG